MGNSKCVGFTQYSTKKFKLNTKRTLTKSAGYIAYRKDGLGVISNGYLWQVSDIIIIRNTADTANESH